MLYFSPAKTIGILLTSLIICAFAIPNFIPEQTVRSWPGWAQRHVVLGLDLQGGSRILLEVDTNAVRKEKLTGLQEDVRRIVRESRFGSPNSVVVRGNAVEFRLGERVDQETATTKFR